jgi:DNA-binding response OmpR family regulator
VAKVLVIEDDSDVRNYLVTVLTRSGHTVAAASGGAEGLVRYREDPADVVITDIIMPEKDGIETIVDLRRGDSAPKVIAISGGGLVSPHDYLRSAKLLGADLALAKPFTGGEILAAVEQVLRGPTAVG